MMEGIVDVFVFGVGLPAPGKEASRMQAGVGRQHYGGRHAGKTKTNERLLTLRRDGVHRNGLSLRSEAYRSLYELGPRRA